MNKKTREYLFGLFVVLFLIITSILSLFATGYRFNLTWPLKFNQLLEQTGTIALNTNPEGAIITISDNKKINFLDKILGKKNEKKTPYKIKNLTPGEYTISFKLEGYWPYQKKVRVNPQQTTFLENIILFKNSLPLNVVLSESQSISYSPNNRYAWFKKSGSIIDLKEEKIINTFNSEDVNWVDNGKQIINNVKLLNLDNNNIKDFSTIIGDCEKLKKQENGDTFVCQSNSQLLIFNAKTNSSKTINNTGEVFDFLINDNYLLVVIKENNQTKIKVINLENNEIKKESESILNSTSFLINHNDSNNFIIIDNDHRVAYLVNLNNTQSIISRVINKISAWEWVSEENIFYATGQEIYHYDAKKDQKKLITRIGENINSLSWSNKNYLVYSTSKSIGIINLIDEQNDITSIWKNKNISSLLLDDKDEIIYFFTSIGQQSGLYKMNIR